MTRAMADSYESPNAWSERSALAADWRWLCRLSLVEPIVAVAWHAALSRSLGVPNSYGRSLLLFASLWLVYIADRLLDVKRLPGSRRPRTERHRFVYDHPRVVTCAWCVVFLASIAFAWANLSAREWAGGAVVCSLTGLYLWFVHRSPSSALRLRERGAKELGVAVLFVAGSTLFVWTHEAFGSVGSWLSLGFACFPFFVVALHNLLSLARRERHIDTHHNSPSVAWSGGRGALLERLIAASSILAALVNLTLITFGLPARGVPLAMLLPLHVGAALGSSVLLIQDRIFPSLNQDAQHVIADVAVLLAAVPALVLPAPFG